MRVIGTYGDFKVTSDIVKIMSSRDYSDPWVEGYLEKKKSGLKREN